MHRPGFFGHCGNSFPVKFMQNIDLDECVFTKKTCKEMSFKDLGQMKIRSTGLRESKLITAKPGR
jgi:hypothetical protein